MLQQLSASTATAAKSKPVLPPAMALHSFMGTVHHVKLLLAWEKQITGCEVNNDDVIDDQPGGPHCYTLDFSFDQCLHVLIGQVAMTNGTSNPSSTPTLSLGQTGCASLGLCGSRYHDSHFIPGICMANPFMSWPISHDKMDCNSCNCY